MTTELPMCFYCPELAVYTAHTWLMYPAEAPEDRDPVIDKIFGKNPVAHARGGDRGHRQRVRLA